MQPTVEKRHIEITLGTCGGKPRIAGHRVRVQDIVVWTEQGQSPDEIVAHIASITLADVYAALAYYHDHRAEIDRDIRLELEQVAQRKAQGTSTLEDRLPGADAGPDPISS